MMKKKNKVGKRKPVHPPILKVLSHLSLYLAKRENLSPYIFVDDQQVFFEQLSTCVKTPNFYAEFSIFRGWNVTTDSERIWMNPVEMNEASSTFFSPLPRLTTIFTPLPKSHSSKCTYYPARFSQSKSCVKRVFSAERISFFYQQFIQDLYRIYYPDISKIQSGMYVHFKFSFFPSFASRSNLFLKKFFFPFSYSTIN